MNLVILIVFGGALGWIINMILEPDCNYSEICLAIVAGIVGALLADFLLAPLFQVGSILAGDYNILALAIAA